MANDSKTDSQRGFRLFGSRILAWMAAVLVGFVLLIFLFIVEENWRGKHAWEKYRKEAEARGVEFDFKKFIPPEVPDDQNFAQTPFLAPLFDLNPLPLKPGQSLWRDTNGYNRAQSFATNFTWDYQSQKAATVMGVGHLANMDEMASNLWKNNKLSGPVPTGSAAAMAILDNMKQYDSVIQELRTASHRPFSRFNIRYDEENPAAIFLAHLANIKKICRLLEVRAFAELSLGQNQAAFEDLKFMDYLTASVRDEPLIITHLVRFILFNFSDQVVWEGVARNKWTEAQLIEIQSWLSEVHLLNDTKHSMEGERASFGTTEFDYLRQNPREISDMGGFGNGKPSANAYMFVPQGWLYLEQVNYQRAFDEKILPGVDLETGTVHPHEIEKNFGYYTNGNLDFVPPTLPSNYGASFLKHNLLATMLTPLLGKVYRKAALAQTGVNQTIIACALERYRLANGKLPDTLDALVPKYLEHVPMDICNGQPLIYRPGKGNQLVLYSVGWNETDDGGITAFTQAGWPEPTQGDWVWPEYPAKSRSK